MSLGPSYEGAVEHSQLGMAFEGGPSDAARTFESCASLGGPHQLFLLSRSRRARHELRGALRVRSSRSWSAHKRTSWFDSGAARVEVSRVGRGEGRAAGVRASTRRGASEWSEGVQGGLDSTPHVLSLETSVPR